MRSFSAVWLAATVGPPAGGRLQHTLSILAAAAILGMGNGAHAQATAPEVRTVTTAAGARYEAGPLHRWILGPHRRSLWTETVEVPVLDLDRTSGGLRPLKTGGGRQTRSLRLLGADGREYAFRSVDKDPSAILDTVFHGTLLDDIVQDGISAAHPFGALVVPPLLDAVGILHVEPRLAVMPDDPALGEFRQEFAGMLGLLEERPDENEGAKAAFAGARKVIGSDRLTERLEDGPDDRVDARAYLTARLVDILLGDWDRHRGQWRWATFDDGEPRSWLPVPLDRDQALSRFDGAATKTAALYVTQFVEFGPEYPAIIRLHWNSRAIDRWFLAELDRHAWQRVADQVQRAVTDSVITQAVLRLPDEIYALDGEELAASLRARRDRLPEAAGELYRLMSRVVDVHATDTGEWVVVDRRRTGRVTVEIAREGASDPYFRRAFLAGETDEVRIHLHDGDDRVEIRGGAARGVTVRIVGGEGDDEYVAHGPTHGVLVYDHEGEDVALGAEALPIDRRPWKAWQWSPDDRDQPRDWGHRTLPTFWSSYSSDLGPFLGAGVRHERYGFRAVPFASAVELRAGYTPTLGKGRAELDAVLSRPNSSHLWTASARVSGLDVLHFHGMGNQSIPGSESFHRVDLTRASASVGLGVAPAEWLEVSGRLVLQRSATRRDPARFFSTLEPTYGDDTFATLGAEGRLVLDPRGQDETEGSRVRLILDGAVHPALLDAQAEFGRVAGEVSTLLRTPSVPEASLALRGGAERVFGRFPWHEAAFIGGQETLRGFNEQRFAGDAAIHASGELRLGLTRRRLIVPTGIGVFGFVDTGRVYLNGSSPGGWHSGAGGGLLLQPAGQPYLARIGAATSSESTKVFVTVGLPY